MKWIKINSKKVFFLYRNWDYTQRTMSKKGLRRMKKSDRLKRVKGDSSQYDMPEEDLRQLHIKYPDEHFGYVMKNLGIGQFHVRDEDGNTVIAHPCGNIKQLNLHTVVLFGCGDTGLTKKHYRITMKFTPGETKKLRDLKLIRNFEKYFNESLSGSAEEKDDGIDFEEPDADHEFDEFMGDDETSGGASAGAPAFYSAPRGKFNNRKHKGGADAYDE